MTESGLEGNNAQVGQETIYVQLCWLYSVIPMPSKRGGQK